MRGLRLLIQVQPEKRREFIQSVKSLLPKEVASASHSLLLQSIDDENFICVMVTCDEMQALDTYLQSDRFRAFRGAVRALGSWEELQITEFHLVPLECITPR